MTNLLVALGMILVFAIFGTVVHFHMGRREKARRRSVGAEHP